MASDTSKEAKNQVNKKLMKEGKIKIFIIIRKKERKKEKKKERQKERKKESKKERKKERMNE